MQAESTFTTEEAEYRYQACGEGETVITRCVAHVAHVTVPEHIDGLQVVALGDASFASTEDGRPLFKAFTKNSELESVALPHGLQRIGRAAFRGCHRLSSITLPETLESIDDLAFSFASVRTLRLPASCTHLSERALRTGPDSLTGSAAPYLSKLDDIEVDAGNPVYCMHGNTLCRRIGDGELEAILCPGKAEEVRLGRAVTHIAQTAFAGTYELDTLAFCESVTFENACGISAEVSCNTVDIELARPREGLGRLSLAMPSKVLQQRILGATAGHDVFDLLAFLEAYDAAIAEEKDRLLQVKLMVARLARPVSLAQPTRASFEHIIEENFDTVCVHFGARNYWQGFDDLVDAGLLDAGNFPHVIEVLSARADTTATAYLLELEHTKLGQNGWDYAL